MTLDENRWIWQISVHELYFIDFSFLMNFETLYVNTVGEQ